MLKKKKEVVVEDKEEKLEVKEVKEEPKFDPSLPERKQRHLYA